MCRGRIAEYPGGPGGWQGPQQLRGGSSDGEAQVLRQQPAIDGIPRVEASRKLRWAELGDGMLKTPKSAASGVSNLWFLRRALDDGYFGQPDNEEVVTKEDDFISCACVCRMT